MGLSAPLSGHLSRNQGSAPLLGHLGLQLMCTTACARRLGSAPGFGHHMISANLTRMDFFEGLNKIILTFPPALTILSDCLPVQTYIPHKGSFPLTTIAIPMKVPKTLFFKLLPSPPLQIAPTKEPLRMTIPFKPGNMPTPTKILSQKKLIKHRLFSALHVLYAVPIVLNALVRGVGTKINLRKLDKGSEHREVGTSQAAQPSLGRGPGLRTPKNGLKDRRIQKLHSVLKRSTLPEDPTHKRELPKAMTDPSRHVSVRGGSEGQFCTPKPSCLHHYSKSQESSTF